METLNQNSHWILLIFFLGYIGIILEPYIKVNKATTALLMSIGCWAMLIADRHIPLAVQLKHFEIQVYNASQVIFFLLGALTIVELVRAHKGFRIVSDWLNVRSKRQMLWLVGLITFFMSSILDNLTTTIVMISLLQRLIHERLDRCILGSIVVIAANAGGAWTPIGDVSTTLLWINGQISAFGIMRALFAPSIFSLIACLVWYSFKFKGQFQLQEMTPQEQMTEPKGKLILTIGIVALLFVPFFKLWTHLPPFMGMLFGLGILWVITDLAHHKYQEREHLRIPSILTRVDMSGTFFYLGVLLSISSLEVAGLLNYFSAWLEQKVHNPILIAISIGLISSVVDNVSLVAGTIGMYELTQYPLDHFFWELIAFCAGTGGSIFIIGSAAGVVLMAVEKVTFIWYLKEISLKALLGYFVGIAVYLLFRAFF